MAKFPYQKELDRFVHRLPQFKDGINYWVIRTEGGSLYDSYVRGKYISIGYNEINYSDIQKAHQRGSNDQLKDLIKERIPDVGNPGLAANQLLRFTYDIKKGDIVIIPSKGSNRIQFGYIDDNILYDKFKIVRDTNKFSKARQVTWFKEITRYKAEKGVRDMVGSHLAVFNVTKHKESIHRSLFDFYKSEGKYHLVLRIRSSTPILTKDVSIYGLSVIDILSHAQREFGIDGTPEELTESTEYGSPGFIEYILDSGVLLTFLGIGLLMLTLTKSKFKFKHGDEEISFKTEGLLHTIFKFILNLKKLGKTQEVEEFNEDHDVKESEEISKEFLEDLKKHYETAEKVERTKGK